MVKLHSGLNQLVFGSFRLCHHRLEPIMLEKLFGGPSFSWILLETVRDEIFCEATALPVSIQQLIVRFDHLALDLFVKHGSRVIIERILTGKH